MNVVDPWSKERSELLPHATDFCFSPLVWALRGKPRNRGMQCREWDWVNAPRPSTSRPCSHLRDTLAEESSGVSGGLRWHCARQLWKHGQWQVMSEQRRTLGSKATFEGVPEGGGVFLRRPWERAARLKSKTTVSVWLCVLRVWVRHPHLRQMPNEQWGESFEAAQKTISKWIPRIASGSSGLRTPLKCCRCKL